MLAFIAFAFFCAITWKSAARHTSAPEIYSTLTTDASGLQKKDTVPLRDSLVKRDSGINRPTNPATNLRTRTANDTIPPRDSSINVIDTFNLRLSKDTLEGPVQYEAEDSAVILIQLEKIILYGKTKTVYNDITLTAPKVEMDQATNLMTAFSDRDSLGEIATRARFEQGENNFESDTIQFNFKTQRGITRNTYTQQQEMFVQGETIKKVDANTLFVRHGRFTTCNLDHPHFAFTAGKIKVINNKVAVTGPTHPEFEGVPVPVYLPFGYFPLNTGRRSGLLPVEYEVNEAFGIGLTGIGYHKVINDYVDVTVRGSIYSYGGWNANVTPMYRKRYRYTGGMNFSLQNTKQNFKGDPDYSKSRTFMVSWNHSIDPRARPGTNFSANVNAGSSRFNELLPNSPNRNFQNQLQSSVSYSKTWAGKPYNLSLSANHNQNNNTRLMHLTLPDVGFTVNTIYPLQSKDMAGTPKWYERLGIGYNGVARNQLSFYDTAQNSIKSLLDTLQWGAQHRIPISLSLPPLGPFVIAPNVSYEETWLTSRIRRQWNRANNKLDTISNDKGFYTDRQMSFGLSFNTAVYGMMNFRNSRLVALRHVIRPNFSFNYRPNMSRKHYDIVQTDSTGKRFYPYSHFSGNNMFAGYSFGRYGGISFSVDNNLEMKWRSKKDTGEAAIKKVRLIDGFGFNSGYNYLADSLSPKLQPFNLYLRSTLFDKINLSASAVLNPYEVTSDGLFDYSRYTWQGNRFSPGRLTSVSVSMSTDFRSKTRDGKEATENNNNINEPVITDPLLMADQERLLEYMQRNPSQFVDFNIPWSVSVGFTLSLFKRFDINAQEFVNELNSNVNFNGSFSMTPKWNFTANGYYDFNTMALQMFAMSISREMHCWQMSINVAPVGQWRYFSFTINPKSSLLQDLRINRTRTFTDF